MVLVLQLDISFDRVDLCHWLLKNKPSRELGQVFCLGFFRIQIYAPEGFYACGIVNPSGLMISDFLLMCYLNSC